MMEEFQFTGDTPALYYAQAGWEYKHNNTQKAEEWTNSANKIYSPALNGVFADAFYDVGWLQRPEGTTAPAVAFDTSGVAASGTEGGPAVEPSPIPDKGLAASKQSGTLVLAAPSTSAPDGGMELASAGTAANQTNSPTEQSVAQPPSTSTESTTASQPVAPDTASASTVSSNQNQTGQQPAAQTSPEQASAVATASQSDTASASTVSSNPNQAEQKPAAQTSPPNRQVRGQRRPKPRHQPLLARRAEECGLLADYSWRPWC